MVLALDVNYTLSITTYSDLSPGITSIAALVMNEQRQLYPERPGAPRSWGLCVQGKQTLFTQTTDSYVTMGTTTMFYF